MGHTDRMKRVLLSSLLSAVLAAGVAWIVRGTYDEIMLDEGVFHVVNAGAVPRSIELTFPSGERRRSEFKAGQAVEFQVASTGEGAVSVMVDGDLMGLSGYVTSHNSLSVLVVQSDGVLFSQHNRSQKSTP